MNKLMFAFCLVPFLSCAAVECTNIESSDQIYLCSAHSLKDSDDKLNKEYKTLLSGVTSTYASHKELRGEYINKIKSSQRAWLDFRDKNCEVLSYQIESGSQAYETSMNLCKDKITKERTQEIISIRNQ